MQVNYRNLIRECIREVLKENLSETATPHPHQKTKKDIYALLEKAGFRQEGSQPREYMEYYLHGFATVFCMVRLDPNENEVMIQRYYDSERLDSMKGYHIEKSIPLPEAYTEEFVKEVVKECLRLQRSIRGDESIYGGMDDVGEGFDPQSQGPNPVDDTGNPYAKWNSDMQKMEEGEGSICGTCNGSGEGMADGTKCSSCGGSGDSERPWGKKGKRHDPDYEPEPKEDPAREWGGMDEAGPHYDAAMSYLAKKNPKAAYKISAEKQRQAILKGMAGKQNEGMNETLKLTPSGGEDDWSRPIYTDQNGKIYVDINLGKGGLSIHSVTDQGEPDVPVKNFKLVSSAPKNKHPNALCPRCKNSKPELMKKTPEGKMSCTYCHWEESPSEPHDPKDTWQNAKRQPDPDMSHYMGDGDRT